MQVIIITTGHWTKTWFTKILIAGSAYAHLQEHEIEFCDIATGSWDSNLQKLVGLLRQHGENSRCFACTDVAMDIYSAAVEFLKGEVALTGAHFLSFFLATNKLASRKLIDGCGGIGCEAVMSDAKLVPDLGITGFFKPLAECGSKGVFRCDSGIEIPNPLIGTITDLVTNETIRKFASNYSELQPYLDTKLVGLVEEYVPAEGRLIVSVDGFVCNGTIHHYTISENWYKPGTDDFDSLVTPSPSITSEQATACWTLYDRVVGDLVRRGLDNQFVDYECFIFPSGRVEVMEVNCRTFSNQLPLFSRVFGREACMFSHALELLGGQAPALTSTNAPADPQGRVGVCAYLPYLPHGPDYMESKDGSAIFYQCNSEYDAHVYVLGSDAAEARRKCDQFYAEVKQAYSCHEKLQN
jgi:hypothetical protein